MEKMVEININVTSAIFKDSNLQMPLYYSKLAEIIEVYFQDLLTTAVAK